MSVKRILTGVSCVMLVASGLQAQRAVASAESSVIMAHTVLQKPVSLQLDKVSIKDALERVAVAAQIRVQYQEELLKPVTREISLRLTHVTVGQALASILSGTSLQVVPVSSDLITIKAMPIGAVFTDGTVLGKVISGKTGGVVAGAKVQIEGMEVRVESDTEGRFRMVLAPGEYHVTVHALGFVRKRVPVTVVDGKEVSLEIQLEPSASILDEVVVTGTVVATERKAITTPITVITAEEIERRGVTRIEELLRGEVPGVVAMDAGAQRYVGAAQGTGEDTLGKMVSSVIYSRGSASISTNGQPTPLKTFIDGVEMLDPSHLGTIDPASIERIEIVTGPQAATIYGSGAMGGVMQIFTKKGSGTTSADVSLRLRYTMMQNSFSDSYTPAHNHGIGIMGVLGPSFSYSGTLSYNYSGQWQPALYSRSYSGSIGATVKQAPVTVTGSMSVTNGSNGTSGRVNVASSPLELSRQISGVNELTNRAGYYSRRVATAYSQLASLNVDYAPMSSWRHHVTVGRNSTNLRLVPEQPVFSSPDDTLFRSTAGNGDRTTAGYNTTAISPRMGSMISTLTVGLNGAWGEQTQLTGCLAAVTSSKYLACNAFPEGMSITQVFNNESWGGFGNLQVGLWDRLYLNLGVRGERNPAYGRNHKIDWTPTNGAAYTMEIGEFTMKLLGSYGRATRAPSPEMRMQIVSNSATFQPSQALNQLEATDLTPEYSRGPQGGVEIYYGNHASITVNRYRQKVSDLIQRVIVDSVPRVNVATGDSSFWRQFQYINAATIQQHGWEGLGSISIKSLTLRGTYSWNDSRVLSSRQTNLYPGYSFLNAPTHAGSMTFSYAAGRTSLSLVTNYIGSKNINRGDHWLYNNLFRLRQYLDRKPNTAAGVDRQSGYAKADLVMAHRVTPWATVNLNVNNVSNSYRSDVSVAFPTLGRQTAIGISLRGPLR